MEDLIKDLRERLFPPIDADFGSPNQRTAQRRFAHSMSYGRHFGPSRHDARRAAVLVLLRWDESIPHASVSEPTWSSSWTIPLMRRKQNNSIHAGQICLPGGGLEQGEDVVEAALRECQEELGWNPGKGAVVGALSRIYVYASNNVVTPIVAVTSDRPQWSPDDREVADMWEVPLSLLSSAEGVGTTRVGRFGTILEAACYQWGSRSIWGATAMILAELFNHLANPQVARRP